ncbi:LysE family transporter [Actinosynnema pretiosum subsp. pretiosum]|nr:LysE family transporter [Actinosynnema mirum]QUF08257.1 LysE family transporter [Actinosynnema pretiosum subsp. pretiosum]
MMYAMAAGLGTGLSLIVVIGSQNALVLRQGVLRDRVPLVVAICATSDVLLIALGVGGLGGLFTSWPPLLEVVRWFGAAFLLAYGALALRRALRPGDGLTAAPVAASALVATCLALTWLNPHVYLDTVLLLGTASTAWGDLRWWFGVGAMVASVLWFCVLGFGAGRLAGVFARPSAWRVLDGVVAVVVTAAGISLIW